MLFQATKFVVIGYSGPGKLKLPKCLILKTIPRDKQNGHQKSKMCDEPVLKHTSKASKDMKAFELKFPFITHSSYKLALPSVKMTCRW